MKPSCADSRSNRSTLREQSSTTAEIASGLVSAAPSKAATCRPAGNRCSRFTGAGIMWMSLTPFARRFHQHPLDPSPGEAPLVDLGLQRRLRQRRRRSGWPPRSGSRRPRTSRELVAAVRHARHQVLPLGAMGVEELVARGGKHARPRGHVAIGGVGGDHQRPVLLPRSQGERDGQLLHQAVLDLGGQATNVLPDELQAVLVQRLSLEIPLTEGVEPRLFAVDRFRSRWRSSTRISAKRRPAFSPSSCTREHPLDARPGRAAPSPAAPRAAACCAAAAAARRRAVSGEPPSVARPDP